MRNSILPVFCVYVNENWENVLKYLKLGEIL